jgi:hypothetical protein
MKFYIYGENNSKDLPESNVLTSDLKDKKHSDVNKQELLKLRKILHFS